MRTLSKLCCAFLLLSIITLSQVQNTEKMPGSGDACINVVSKLQNLKVGKMRVKTCCAGITLIADVTQQRAGTGKKKTISAWHVVNSAGDELHAYKGPLYSSSSPNTKDIAIQTADSKACFIIEKNVAR